MTTLSISRPRAISTPAMGPLPPKRADGEVARVAAAVGRHGFHRSHHGGDGDRQDPVGGRDGRQPERCRDLLGDHPQGGIRVELEVAAHELNRVEVAEDDERVGECRARPALAVAGRARDGACAHGADPDRARRLRLDDAASARSDLGDVDEGELDRVATALDEPAREVDPSPHFVLARPHRRAVLEQRRLRGRAAHVERDEVVPAGEPG